VPRIHLLYTLQLVVNGLEASVRLAHGFSAISGRFYLFIQISILQGLGEVSGAVSIEQFDSGPGKPRVKPCTKGKHQSSWYLINRKSPAIEVAMLKVQLTHRKVGYVRCHDGVQVISKLAFEYDGNALVSSFQPARLLLLCVSSFRTVPEAVDTGLIISPSLGLRYMLIKLFHRADS
jgi:hypothetical protein